MQLVESTKEETERKNNYNLVKQGQDYAISEAEANKDDKSSDLGVQKGTWPRTWAPSTTRRAPWPRTPRS